MRARACPSTAAVAYSQVFGVPLSVALEQAEVLTDRVTQAKETYEKYGEGGSNLADGYVARNPA